MIRLLVAIALTVACIRAQAVHALPPLGLTQIEEEPDEDAQIAIVDDVAYISGRRDIWVLDDSANIDTFRLTHAELGMHSNPSRVVKGPDERLYVGATFLRSDTSLFSDGVALFALSNVNEPVATGEAGLNLVGFGSDLRGVANRATGQSVRLLVDGTFEELQFPQGTPNMEAGFVASMSESGYAVGFAFVPGTIGDAASLWTPSGDHSFLDTAGNAVAVRDRSDGNGLNIGWYFGSEVRIKYGEMDPIVPKGPDGSLIAAGERGQILTETDFAVLRVSGTSTFFGFQPGLVPGHPDTALPIETIFPELATIDFNWISDATVVDAHVFMTLSGDDGLFLFGAPAPVSIPEPATLALAILTLAFAVVAMHARTARSKSHASSVSNA